MLPKDFLVPSRQTKCRIRKIYELGAILLRSSFGPKYVRNEKREQQNNTMTTYFDITNEDHIGDTAYLRHFFLRRPENIYLESIRFISSRVIYDLNGTFEILQLRFISYRSEIRVLGGGRTWAVCFHWGSEIFDKANDLHHLPSLDEITGEILDLLD